MTAVARVRGIVLSSRGVSSINTSPGRVIVHSFSRLTTPLLSASACVALRHTNARTFNQYTHTRSVIGFPITERVSCVPRVLRRTYKTSPIMDRNGDTRKRKTSPVDIADRPPKQLKPGTLNTPDGTPQGSMLNGVEINGDAPQTLPVTATAETPEWQATIEKVVRNVVSIQFCQTCSFDTDSATASEATGFVVDSEKGFILTNRHVVGPGPFWGYCIFDNHEEVGNRGIYIRRREANDCSIVRCLPCLQRPCP